MQRLGATSSRQFIMRRRSTSITARQFAAHEGWFEAVGAMSNVDTGRLGPARRRDRHVHGVAPHDEVSISARAQLRRLTRRISTRLFPAEPQGRRPHRQASRKRERTP